MIVEEGSRARGQPHSARQSRHREEAADVVDVEKLADSCGAGLLSSASWVRPALPANCPVCLCEFAVQEVVCLTECGHQFCEDCITMYVQSKAKEGAVLPAQMCCPHAEPAPCNRPLAPADVLRCLNEDEKQRYQRLTGTVSHIAAAPGGHSRVHATCVASLQIASPSFDKLTVCVSSFQRFVESGEDMQNCPTAGKCTPTS